MKIRLYQAAIICALSLAPATTAAKEKAKKPTVYHVCSKNDSARDVLACNIYKEARGEGLSGMLAVGLVTLNRRDMEKFPVSMRGVVYQKKQFSWANSGKNNKVTHRLSWKQSKSIATFLIRIHKTKLIYKAVDFTHGSVYFHTKSVAPVWRHALRKTVTIGNHVFYREV